MIPAAARGLKKNLGWTLGSKMSDNEDALASLGHSEVLSVEKSPDAASPRPSGHTCACPSGGRNRDIGAHKGCHDLCEVHASVGAESAFHVLPDGPLDAEGDPDALVVPVEAGAGAVESRSLAGPAEVLAGGAADEEAGPDAEPSQDGVRVGFALVGEPGEVVVDRHAWEAGGEELAAPAVPLAEPDGAVTGAMESEVHASGP